jgi:type IX secretion system substrate protein
MKPRILVTIAISLFILTQNAVGQQKSDYSTIFVDGIFEGYQSASSTYWYGHTYVFYNEGLMENSMLSISKYKQHENGSVEFVDVYQTYIEFPFETNITSCTYKNNLYAFYWYQPQEGSPEIKYVEKKIDSAWNFNHSIPINENISKQMSAVTYNDTIYMFFVDDADSYVKYHRIYYSDTQKKLVLVNETPISINTAYTAYGNVSAITYFDKHLNERIMVAFPGVILSRTNNDIMIYAGVPGNIEYYDNLLCYNDYHIDKIAMAQGSVNGGYPGSYNIQFGYNHAESSHKGPFRCELNVDTREFGNWEVQSWDGEIASTTVWFMEMYTKATHHRKKFLIQGYIRGDGAGGSIWESDILEYQDQISEVAPFDFASKFFDLILVAEGAPPYTLNGFKLSDHEFDGNAPSTFQYIKGTENSVSASTTYSLSADVNMGVGPVTAGFKASFLESSGTSYTESNYITQNIIAPKIDADSAGLMWYYYIAPTVVRSRWLMKDFNGNEITPNRNLFFFEVNSPQMLNMSYPLDHFGDNSPRAYDLESYMGRGVTNIDGVEEITHVESVVDFGGSTASADIDFQESHTQSHDKTYEVDLGIDVNYGIFSASASVSASVEYHRERTTTCENGFHIEWALFAPYNPHDPNNIRRFTPISYIMKTKDNSAYFLLDEFKDYKPFFITYEVDSITTGDFIDPPYYIKEYEELIKKYNLSVYPNPCNDKARIMYTLQNQSDVMLNIYNSMGMIVSSSGFENQPMGNQRIELPAEKLPNGIYIYKLLIDNDLIVGKIIKN